MTHPKSILAGICMGLICFAVIGASAWHYLLSESGPQVLSRKWFVSSPVHLDRKTLSSDVWLYPDSPLLEPVGIQRVEWQDASVGGRDAWGYFVVYRARVTDAPLSERLRGMTSVGLKALPSWATHLPSWWHPQRSISSDRLSPIDLQSNEVFMEVTEADVFIYWIRAPHEGHL
jgi:hypothetical protein